MLVTINVSYVLSAVLVIMVAHGAYSAIKCALKFGAEQNAFYSVMRSKPDFSETAKNIKKANEIMASWEMAKNKEI
jgi:hypothetical protein